MTLSEWITKKRGRAPRLAEALGLPNPARAVLVYQWAGGSRQVPAERCPDIEAATGGAVTCEELRPDVSWHVLRNAPLVDRGGAHAATVQGQD